MTHEDQYLLYNYIIKLRLKLRFHEIPSGQFAELPYLTGIKRTTRVIHSELNPEWNEVRILIFIKLVLVIVGYSGH